MTSVNKVSARGVGWCSGQPVPCGGIRSHESVGLDPVLAPALEFCIWRSRFALPDYITARNQGDRGLPEPSKARASSPAGFHRVRHIRKNQILQSIPAELGRLEGPREHTCGARETRETSRAPCIATKTSRDTRSHFDRSRALS